MVRNLITNRQTRGSHAYLAVVAGQIMVFGQAQQKLFELNDTAAYIWRSLEDGIQLEGVINELAEHGVDRNVAEDYVCSALREWNRLGIRPPPPVPPRLAPGKAHLCQDIELAGLHIRIRYRTARAYPAASIFRHLEIEGETPSLWLDVVEQGPEHHLIKNNHWFASCSAEELAPLLKVELLTEVLAGSDYELALHTASLVQDERMLLICGHPGAGKTTLALALAHAGFGFAGDDLALLDSTGRVTGVPFVAAAKAGAWDLLAGFQPDIRKAPVFRRPDRKRVRFILPHGLVSAVPRPVGWLVLLRRRSGAEASLRPLDPADAFSALLEDAHAQHERLTRNGFAALVSTISAAKCYCLTYSSLEDAVARLQEACR